MEKNVVKSFVEIIPWQHHYVKDAKCGRLKNFLVTGLVLEIKYDSSDEVWFTLSRNVNSQNNGCGYYKSTRVVYEVFCT